MPTVSSNGIRIAYEDHGNAGDPVLFMVQGLGMPLAAWPPALIEALRIEGFRVITFDNRDVGESQLLDEHRPPGFFLQMLRAKLGMKVKAPYQLTDMARDAQGLLVALNIRAAHVVGISMGGMISQLLAIHAPERVRSLTSIMSTTGNRKLPGPSKPVTRQLMRRPKNPTSEERLAYYWKMWRLIASPEYRSTDEELGEFLERIFARGMTAAGAARQTFAILAAASRVPELRELEIPTLVLHGEADPLVPVECGRDTASAIPGSNLVTIPGMGHDLPRALLPRIVNLITEHAKTADMTGGHMAA